LFLTGLVQRRQGHWEESTRNLERAVELAPDRSDLLLEVASLYRLRGQNARCLTAIYHLLDSYPSGEEPQSVLVMQGQTLMDLGRPQQATDAFLAAIQSPAGAPFAFTVLDVANRLTAGGATEACRVAR